MANSKTYTCPMHPEVVNDKPGNCPKCGMKLVEREKSMKNRIWMLVVCLLPLVVMLLLLLFGIKINYSWIIFVALVGCCILPMLLMRRKHKGMP